MPEPGVEASADRASLRRIAGQSTVMAALSKVVARKLTRLGQFVYLTMRSGGLRVPLRAATRHVLPIARDFVAHGGELRAEETVYRTFRGPGNMDYAGLPFVRSLVDAGFSVDVEDNEAIVKVAEGLSMHVPLHLAYSGLGMVDERFVRKEFESVDVQGAVVIDVGANIGDSAVYFIARGAYRVLAYEPFSATADVAAGNIAYNKLEDRVELHRVGIAGTDSTRRAMYDPVQPHLASAAAGDGAGIAVDVHLTTLVSAVTRARDIAGEAHFIVLKVDCEGCEGEIFTDDVHALDGVATTVVETHSDQLKRHVIGCLQKSGFACSVEAEEPSLSTALVVGRR